MKDNFEYRTLKFLFIQILLFSMLFSSPIIRNLRIVGEKDTLQVKNHHPRFKWSITGKVKDWVYRFKLSTPTQKGDSIIWETGEIYLPDSTFLFQENLLRDGFWYSFSVSKKLKKDEWSDWYSVNFRMNTVPQVPDILPPDTIIASGKLLEIQFKPSKDREVSEEFLWYQIVVSTDSGRIDVVFDTTFQSSPNLKGARFYRLRIENNFPEDRLLYISARAFDGAEFSNWSRPQKIFVSRVDSPPSAFKISKEIPDTVGGDISVRWQQSKDPEYIFSDYLRYKLQVFPDSTLQKPVFEKILKDTSYKIPIDSLRNHTRYSLRVLAVDIDGNQRESQNTIKFIVNTGNRTPPVPDIIRPTGGAVLKPDSYVVFREEKDPDGDFLTYTIYVLNDTGDKTICFTKLGGIIPDSVDGVKRVLKEDSEIIKAKLSVIVDTTLLEEGKFYRIQVGVDDGWGGRVISSWNISIFLYDDGLNFVPTTPDSGFYPDRIVITKPTPILKWGRSYDRDVQDRLIYEITVGHDSTFSSGKYLFLRTRDETPYIFLNVPLLENRKYYWRVRAVDSYGAHSGWSRVNTFWVNFINEPPEGPITLLYPPDLSEINYSGFLSWQGTVDPDPFDTISYMIEIDKEGSFYAPVVRKILGHKEGNDPIEVKLRDICDSLVLEDNSLYFWRVRAIDNHGVMSRPQLYSPRFIYNAKNDPPLPPSEIYLPIEKGVVTSVNPVISWEPGKDPDFSDLPEVLKYELQLSTDSTFSDSVLTFTSRIGKNSCRIETKLRDNVRWYCRVRTIDRAGSFSKWSPTRSFLLNAIKEPPQAVTEGLLPSDSMVVKTRKPVITWVPSGDPDPFTGPDKIAYKVEYWRLKKPRQKFTVTTSPGVNYVKIGPLEEDEFYAYRVRAIDPEGLESPWSQALVFAVDAEDSPPSYFELIYPRDGQDTCDIKIIFKWEKSVDKDPVGEIFYRFYLSSDSLFSRNVNEFVIEQTDSETVTFEYPYTLQFYTRYFWKVAAFDKSGNVTWGASTDKKPFSFTTRREFYLFENSSEEYHLYQNVPNPFNITTRIEYYVPRYGMVRIVIYNLLGKRIKTLVERYHSPGRYSVVWDGSDDFGASVPGGVYICKMEAKSYSEQIKLLLLR